MIRPARGLVAPPLAAPKACRMVPAPREFGWGSAKPPITIDSWLLRSQRKRRGRLRQVIQITGAVLLLSRRGWRDHPCGVVEVEKFRHIHLRSVPSGEAGQVESRLDQLQDGG